MYNRDGVRANPALPELEPTEAYSTVSPLGLNAVFLLYWTRQMSIMFAMKLAPPPGIVLFALTALTGAILAIAAITATVANLRRSLIGCLLLGLFPRENLRFQLVTNPANR
jgi:hypothetical protein